jgi:hypothetical protein
VDGKLLRGNIEDKGFLLKPLGGLLLKIGQSAKIWGEGCQRGSGEFTKLI